MTPTAAVAVEMERVRWVLLRLWGALDRASAHLPAAVHAEAERTIFPLVFEALGAALTRVNDCQEALWPGTERELCDALEVPNRAAVEKVTVHVLMHPVTVAAVEREAACYGQSMGHVLEIATRHWFACPALPARLVAHPTGTRPHHNTRKTHCPRGHAYTPENIIWRAGNRRECRACKRLRDERERNERRVRAA